MQEEFCFGQCNSSGNRNLGSLLVGTQTSRLLESNPEQDAVGAARPDTAPCCPGSRWDMPDEALASLVQLKTPEGHQHTMALQRR